MAEAFMGYLLPWGQMSYWGAQVIINLFSAIPFIGADLSQWIRGDYVVGDATLNRFFAFHVVAVPLVLIGLVVAHILALHDVGSNNPDGIEIKGPKAPLDEKGRPLDGIPFHPYYTIHDIFGVAVFLMVFSAIIFFAPEVGGYFLEYNNFIPADPLKTPLHIAPVWYFTPYYSMLRAITTEMMYALSAILVLTVVFVSVKTSASAMTKGLLVLLALAFLWMFNAFGFTRIGVLQGIDAKFWGVVVMIGSVLILFFLPWLDKSPVKSIRYRPGWHKLVLGVFVADFIVLAYLGTQSPTPTGERVSQVGTLFYFGFFLLMPWWTRLGEFKPVPERITFAAH
jgi:ubiquinol-cytochrome c reductase cytochrome b subunit